jgi:DNA gyrase subunit B
MYIGSTNTRGLHHLVYEIVDNSIDEHLAGYCSKIEVIINEDGSITVTDNGRGMPVGIHPSKKIPAVRVIFTVLNAGGKFNNNNYKVSGGLHGVGASVVNALSKWLEVEVSVGGKVYKDRYENGGKPVIELVKGELPAIGKSTETGTKVTFFPDGEIMDSLEFKAEVIKKRLKELSYLNKGLRINFEDKRTGESREFYEEEGIVGFIKDINKNVEKLHDDVIYISGNSSKIEVEIAIQFTNEYTEQILSFCNNIGTIEGGTHVSGFKASLTRIINQYAKELGYLKEKDTNLDGRDIRAGISAIVLLKHPNPQYEGQTKTKLGNSDAKGAVEEIFNIESQKFFDRNVEILKIIIENALKSMKIRTAEEKVRKNLLGGNGKFEGNGKLASCISKNPTECEICIVEGNSAGGSAKEARDRKYQAILPLRGKILNVEKKDISKIITNAEIKSMINSFGCGFGEGYGDDFDIKKLRFDKIIILTDADVDGAHIRTLLLTFFYRYMTELIYEGKVYIGMPPLYKVTKKKATKPVFVRNDKSTKATNLEYCYSDKELEKILKVEGKNAINIQRYKGLGEMNPDQLWETTLDPKTRFLKKVSIEDAVSSDEITDVLMGIQVNPRRDFIYENATFAELDI